MRLSANLLQSSYFDKGPVSILVANYADCRAHDLRLDAGFLEDARNAAPNASLFLGQWMFYRVYASQKLHKIEEIADASQDFASGHGGRSGALGRGTKPGVRQPVRVRRLRRRLRWLRRRLRNGLQRVRLPSPRALSPPRLRLRLQQLRLRCAGSVVLCAGSDLCGSGSDGLCAVHADLCSPGSDLLCAGRPELLCPELCGSGRCCSGSASSGPARSGSASGRAGSEAEGLIKA